MAQVASLIANDHEDEATRLFRAWLDAVPAGAASTTKHTHSALQSCSTDRSTATHDASLRPERCNHTFQVLNNDYLEHKRLYAAVQSVLAVEAQRGPLDVLVSCCTSSPAPMLLCSAFAY